ncbi:M28 family metallopeptidase [soil metagenome]
MTKHLGLSLLALTLIPFISSAFISNVAHASAINKSSRYILTDQILAKKLTLEPLATHSGTDTVLVSVTEAQREDLTHEAHELNRCGGHELITALPADAPLGQAREFAQNAFRNFDAQAQKDLSYKTKSAIGLPATPSTPDARIASAIAEVSESNLKDTVDFLSKFPTRNHKTADAKNAILSFKTRIEETLKGSTVPYTIDFITHTSTPMNSIRLTFKGATNPNEVVVAGGHIDSINQSYFGSKLAPGSDDNASGSANILEAARIISHGPPTARTIEFYWYAGEEGGLLGSAEIAEAAKKSGKKVVGVLQLDMTLFPGDGEFKLGSMTDFTSLEMRDLLVQINRDYLNATIIEDKCGYGCSDHASWYRNGYPTLMPFEATMNRMNGNIHSEKDVVSASSSFRHSAMFSKIAVAFLMILGQ